MKFGSYFLLWVTCFALVEGGLLRRSGSMQPQPQASSKINGMVCHEANGICVGWEDANVYCYGASDGCKWNQNDCAQDSDCSKYDTSSAKYSDAGDEGQCPQDGWRDAACQAQNVDMAKVTSMMKALESKMSYAEFQVFIQKLAEQSKTEPPADFALQAMFKDVDTNSDNSVSAEEFMAFKPSSTPKLPDWAKQMPAGLTGQMPGTPMAPPMPPMAPVAGFGAPAQSNGLKCVGWRKTTTCVPSGPRDPLQDKDCLTIIGSQESGFCECEGYVHTAAVPCGHDPVDCTKECGVIQKMHRETFGADINARANSPGGDSAASPDAQKSGAAVAESKDPYGAALQNGQKAMKDVNDAVENSNKLLGSARNMISKMMNLKPWAEITKLGKDAEEAGKKTEMLAKLARPFIYTQLEDTSN